MQVNKILLIITITFLGLMAGLFYSFTISVMPGLAKTQDRTFLEGMQSINRAIINPLFTVAFVGSILMVMVSSYLQFRQGVDVQFYIILSASLIYLIGTIVLTFWGNVPLNNALDALKINELNPTGLKNARDAFEGPWNRFNAIRTLSSVAALVLYLVAIVRDEG